MRFIGFFYIKKTRQKLTVFKKDKNWILYVVKLLEIEIKLENRTKELNI